MKNAHRIVSRQQPRWRFLGVCLAMLLSTAGGSLFAQPGAPCGWKADWQPGNSAGVYARCEGEYVRIGNEFLERAFRLSDGVVRTVQLVNKVSMADPGAQDEPELALELSGSMEGELGSTDFKLVAINVENSADGKVHVSFHLQCRKDSALELSEEIEAYPHRQYQRKWLVVNWKGDGDVVVNRIDVEKMFLGWWYVGNPVHYGLGQPVFAGDIYLGLEYPGADTGISGFTYLRHYPGRSAKGGLKSKTAIWGVAPDAAHVRQAFFQKYLDTVAPPPPRPFVLYNFLGLGTPSEKKLLPWIDNVGRDCKAAGLNIDSYVLDDGWQDVTTVWQPDHFLFPNGFKSFAEDIESKGSHLGLWLSLDGYTLDPHWGALHGLEVAEAHGRGGRFCLAGPNYNAKLRETLRSFVVDDKVNYFKFDYNSFTCDVPTHGHPIGRAGKDAQIDAYIGLLQYVKELSPRVHTAITSGMWLSPWWTLYADWVWLGGSDSGSEVPSLTHHDSEMTYRDSIVYQDYVENAYVFPFDALMTHGFWAFKGTRFPQYKDDCMLTVGRGITDWEILTSPEQMDAQRYAFLSRAVAWGKANWDILSHTRMILGSPKKGEIYGYTHVGDGAVIVIVRNPSLQSQTITLALKTLGIPDGKQHGAYLYAAEIYPTHAPLDLDLSSAAVDVLGAQTKVLIFAWDKSLVHRLEF